MTRLTLVNISEGFSPGFIPLGLVSIATYAKHYGDHDVAILDANCQDVWAEFKPTAMVGIGAVTQDIGRAVRFAEFVRERYPETLLILGGVHISTYPQLPEPFDIGVIGEGEETVLELLGLPDFSRERLSQVKGLCYTENGQFVRTEPRPMIAPLDRIPIPDRDRVNLDYYLQPRYLIPYHAGRTLSLISSRGCPFSCTFCSTKVFWQKFRAFSAERVVEELDLLIHKYGAVIIHIFDDLFIGNKKRLREIHALMMERGLAGKVKFMCLVRSDILDERIMGLLQDLNVVVIGIGMESGCEDILTYLKRGTATLEDNRRSIELASRYRMPVMGSFMIGNPGESEVELLKTLEFIRGYRYSPYLAPLSYVSAAFPGTEFWNHAVERGIPVENYDKILMDIPDTIEPLREAPLLTEIPLERFFEIIQAFNKETRYGSVKRHIFMPRSWYAPLLAYWHGIRIERSLWRGIREINRIRRAFAELQRQLSTAQSPPAHQD